MIPGFGLVIGGGAPATALATAAGTVAAGAVAGGVTGFLKDQGVDESVARSYEEAIKNGGALVGVNVPSKNLTQVDAEKILQKYGVVSVHIGASFGVAPAV